LLTIPGEGSFPTTVIHRG